MSSNKDSSMYQNTRAQQQPVAASQVSASQSQNTQTPFTKNGFSNNNNDGPSVAKVAVMTQKLIAQVMEKLNNNKNEINNMNAALKLLTVEMKNIVDNQDFFNGEFQKFGSKIDQLDNDRALSDAKLEKLLKIIYKAG